MIQKLGALLICSVSFLLCGWLWQVTSHPQGLPSADRLIREAETLAYQQPGMSQGDWGCGSHLVEAKALRGDYPGALISSQHFGNDMFRWIMLASGWKARFESAGVIENLPELPRYKKIASRAVEETPQSPEFAQAIEESDRWAFEFARLQCHLDCAIKLVNAGRITEAQRFLPAKIEEKNRASLVPDYHLALAEYWLSRDNRTAALAELQTAEEIADRGADWNSRYLEVAGKIVQLLRKANESEQANRLTRKCIALVQSHRDKGRDVLRDLVWLGRLHAMNGELTEAAATFQDADLRLAESNDREKILGPIAKRLRKGTPSNKVEPNKS